MAAFTHTVESCCVRLITSSRQPATTGTARTGPSPIQIWHPITNRVEEFVGIYGTDENLSNLADGKYRGPSWLTKAEQGFKETVEGRWPSRHVIPWRYAAPNLHRVPLGIVAARETGKLTTRTDAIVRQIILNPKTGKADGVVFVDRLTKAEQRVHADLVVLCASTIESVRLLLNSAGEGHGNSSGMLGRYFMDQTPSLVFGADPHHPGHETINPAPDDPYYAPVGGSTSHASTTSTALIRLSSPVATPFRERSDGSPCLTVVPASRA